MKARFLSGLKVQKLGPRWIVLAPFLVELEGAGEAPFQVTVPEGFVTDFASVPRLPLVYLAAGNTAHKAAVLHDYLYSIGHPRKSADAAFLAAMRAEGEPWWRRNLMWSAVRVFGAAGWEAHQEARRLAQERAAQEAGA